MEKSTRLYVANLSYDSTDKDLAEFFKEYGTVKKAVIITDKGTQQSRGFGFVEMSNQQDADRALGANGDEMDGRKLKVAYAQERKK